MRIELLLIDVAFTCDQIKQMVRLLSSRLLLDLVTLYQLCEFRSALGHGTIIALLRVVLLGLTLELLDDLVLLAQLKVQLTKLILKDCLELSVSRSFSLCTTLALFFLFRNEEVFLFNALELSHQ